MNSPENANAQTAHSQHKQQSGRRNDTLVSGKPAEYSIRQAG